MNIAKGRDRIVLVYPKRGIVFKILLVHFITVVQQIFRYAKEGNWGKIKEHWKEDVEKRGSFSNSLFGGIRANWTEFVFYQRTHNCFVQPTYFSLFGIINIQKYGEVCTIKELEEPLTFWNELRALTKGEADIETHHFKDPLNFCMHGTHVRMIDYGNKKVQRVLGTYGDILAEKLHPPHY